jgi:hypothetical protein
MASQLRRWSGGGLATILLLACSGSGRLAADPPACVTTGCPSGKKCDPTLGCVQCVIDADCSQPTPVCIPNMGRCGTCLDNTGCPSAMPACWPSDHNCHLPCNTDADCPRQGSTICDQSTGVGTCVGCRAGSTDCGPDKTCNLTNQQCVGCMSDGDCPSERPHCDMLSGGCVQCQSNGDCGSDTMVCDQNTSTCRPGCTSDPMCSGNTPICNLAISKCVQCVTDGDCASSSAGKICSSKSVCGTSR